MKKLLFLFIILATACQPDEPPQPLEPCEINQTGTIVVKSYSDDRFRLTIGNSLFVTANGNATVEVGNVSAGTYRVVLTNERTGDSWEISDLEVLVCEIALVPIIY